jgi:hypothetical protein
LIVANVAQLATLTTRFVMRLLSDFKRRFPAWHETSLGNSVVELSDIAVEVWTVHAGRAERVAYISFDEQDWQLRLRAVLERNSGTPAWDRPNRES